MRRVTSPPAVAARETVPIDKKMLQITGRYSYVGIFFGVAVCLGYFGGHWLDGRWHTGPWLGLVGLLVGVVAGFRELYRLTRQAEEEEEK